MDWVTIFLAMCAAACLTLATVHVLIWWHQRTAWANLFFCAAAASTAVLAYFELLVMHAGTVPEFAAAMRWAHVPVWVLVIALAGFVRVYLNAGRPWLFWSIVGLRTLSVIANFTTGVSLNYARIDELHHVEYFGRLVPLPMGTANPWMLIGQLSILLLIVFVVDAVVTAARRGDRRKVLRMGIALTVFLAAALIEVLLIFWGFFRAPIIFSPFFLGLLAAMGYELSRDAVRASQLAGDLQESEAESRKLRDQIAHAGRVTMLGQLSAALAHEINQPLGAILRNVEAAQLFLESPNPDMDEVRSILADIHADDVRAGAVIDRMRAMLRQHDLQVESVNAVHLVEDVVALAAADARARRVKIDVETVGQPPTVRADPIQFQQVLLNLLMNGMDAVSTQLDAGGRIVIGFESVAGTAVAIVVTDNGPGVSDEAMGRLFDPFFTTKTKGMGLGLAISRGIAEAHGGSLRAENNAGGGATFRFTLPVGDHHGNA
jgi:signal transduction histidine kinase